VTRCCHICCHLARLAAASMAAGPLTWVGLGRLERPTSSLSGKRSNRLSYRPYWRPERPLMADHAGLGYRKTTLAGQSVSLSVTSMPPAKCVTRL
jgi:hypothetical protein